MQNSYANQNENMPPQRGSTWSFSFFMNPRADNRTGSRDNSRRNEHRQPNAGYGKREFPALVIMGFEKEVAAALKDSQDIQENFKQDLHIINVQLKSLSDEMIRLIQNRKKGDDNSKELIQTYTALYELCGKKHHVIKEHAAALQNIMLKTYHDYTQKIEDKLHTAQTNPEILIEEIIYNYDKSTK